MKSILCAVALCLSFVCFGMPASLAAPDGVARVNGGGTFSVGGKEGHFNFNAVTHANGSVTGHVTLRNPEEVPNQDVDGNGELGSEALPNGAEVRANLDSVNVSGNRVALSGIITSANVPRYIGLRLILAVEDNGESNTEPDTITWGFYQRIIPRLVADAENPDAGAFLVGVKLLATDFENPEAGAFFVGESDFDSNSFPLSSYSLTSISSGNIQAHSD